MRRGVPQTPRADGSAGVIGSKGGLSRAASRPDRPASESRRRTVVAPPVAV